MRLRQAAARACPHLSAAEAAAYEAPYPDARVESRRARAFRNLVPDRPDAPGAAISRQARDWWQNAWKGEAFMAIGARDPVLGPAGDEALRKHHPQLPGALHSRQGRAFPAGMGRATSPGRR